MSDDAKKKQQAQQPDYANMTDKERQEAAMKQAGMAPGDLKKMVAKNMAKNMAASTARNVGRGFFRRLMSKIFK